jgi:hypothetical protein
MILDCDASRVYNSHIDNELGIKKMYAVGINGTWTNDGKSTKEAFEAKGFKVQPARLNGDFDVFAEGKKVATLFTTKSDQIKFLKSKGLI